MNSDLANFSTDLLRISYWIYQGQDLMAGNFLNFCRKNYKNINPKIGCYKNIWEEFDKISNFGTNRIQSSERALTLSRILLM